LLVDGMCLPLASHVRSSVHLEPSSGGDGTKGVGELVEPNVLGWLTVVGACGDPRLWCRTGSCAGLRERVFDGVLLGQDVRGVHPPVRRTATFEGAAASILRRAEGADLVVVGSHGRSTLARLALGSVSSQVVHHTDRPVVVVP
jgi:hypothetical protein